MSKSKEPSQNTTNFLGQVNIGAMSSGEGDINVDSLILRLETSPTSKDFLDALRQFSRELELAKQSGISEDLATQVREEIESSQIEVQKNPINGQSLIKRLNHAKELLVAATGTATAATTTIATTSKLISMLEPLLKAAQQLFG